MKRSNVEQRFSSSGTGGGYHQLNLRDEALLGQLEQSTGVDAKNPYIGGVNHRSSE